MTEGRADLTVQRAPDGVAFWIFVTPRASRERVGGLRGDALCVRVCAPPVEGEANAACVRALARALDVKAKDVGLEPGARGRRKRVRIAGEAIRIERRLRELATRA